MLNRLFGPSTHYYLHLVGLSSLVIGIPTNKVIMSISMMFLLLNLFLEADFRNYYQRLKTNNIFLLALGFYLFHVVALLWSTDLDYGLNDLRVKLPLLVIPLTIIALPLKARDRRLPLYIFTAVIAFTSLFNFGAYIHLFGNFQFDDIRGMSLFGSHTRFGLLIAMAIAICLNQIYVVRKHLILFGSLLIWLVFYTYYSQVLSGYLATAGVFIVFLLYGLFKWKKWTGVIASIVIPLTIILTLYDLLAPISFDPEVYTNLPTQTAEGNPYDHAPNAISPETGKPIEIYISDIELKREWEKHSEIPYDSLDRRGQPIRWTLIRYLSSMDVRKDAQGFASLKQTDIQNIENGVASKYNSGLLARYYGIKFQLNNTDDPNNHSILKRFEYWKTGIQIARENLLIGVGTGDVQMAFDKQYEQNNSILREENRCRTHNYFLTVLISFGLPGIFLFFWFHAEFLLINLQRKQLVAISFMVIILLSYLVEDTLETQTGITFFSFFLALFSDNLQKSEI